MENFLGLPGIRPINSESIDEMNEQDEQKAEETQQEILQIEKSEDEIAANLNP